MHPPRPSAGSAVHHVYTDASLHVNSPELAASALAHIMQDSLGVACQGCVAARASSSHSNINMSDNTHSTDIELIGVIWTAFFPAASMGGAGVRHLRQHGGV
eukprot:5357508-Pyramimonas_sp.AAC.1